MSDAKKADVPETKDAKKSIFSNKKQIIIFAVVGLVFVGLMAGGTIFLLKSLSEDDPETNFETADSPTNSEKSGEQANAEAHKDGKSSSETDKEKAPAVYINMQPAFVVNFAGKDGLHFLQVEVTLMTHEADVEDAVKIHMPLLRNAMVMEFSAQSLDELQTVEGKEKLRKEILESVQAILKKEAGKAGIEDVFFTSMNMQ